MAISASALAIASAVAGTASAAVGAYSAMASAHAQSQAANYQAQVAAHNAKIADQNASMAVDAGNSQAQQQEMKTRALLGNEKAAQAASGLDVNSGTAVDTRSSTALLGTESELSTHYNAAKQALGYEETGASQQTQSQLYKMQAQDAQSAGAIGAGASLLSGAAGVGGNLANFYRTGAIQNPLGMSR